MVLKMKWVLAALLLATAAFAADQPRPNLVWEGDVDDSAVLMIRNEQVVLRPGEGLPVRNPRYHFASKLPDRTQLVHVEVLRGRGQVRLLSNPQLDNDYTAVVRIDDPQPGSFHYALAVRWEVSPYDEPSAKRHSKKKDKDKDKDEPACCDPDQTPVANAIGWTGHVNGTVRVTFIGTSSASEIVSGNLTNEYPRIDRAVPHRDDLKYTIRKVSGGGDVALVEPPSAANGYALVFEIRNGQSADQDYGVEVGWGPSTTAQIVNAQKK